MCFEITSWLRAYFALEQRANELRDLTAIATFFKLPDCDVAEFWRALLARCVELHAQGAPLPSVETWNALLPNKDSHVH